MGKSQTLGTLPWFVVKASRPKMYKVCFEKPLECFLFYFLKSVIPDGKEPTQRGKL